MKRSELRHIIQEIIAEEFEDNLTEKPFKDTAVGKFFKKYGDELIGLMGALAGFLEESRNVNEQKGDLRGILRLAQQHAEMGGKGSRESAQLAKLISSSGATTGDDLAGKPEKIDIIKLIIALIAIINEAAS
tara:strand:- start:1828 stop:2223 length:396 start_codon:yes stop_codon:yes gene_type:complete